MKKMQKYALSILFLLPLGLWAQQSVSGVVSEAANNLPLPGVNVLVKGTTVGTTSDFDGNYTISAEAGDVLVFSYIGFKTIEMTVEGNSLNVAMQEDTAFLEEVVVIGYGAARKEDLTGSVNMVTSDDFNQGPVVSAQQLISGKVAGVSVTSGSGAPGDGQNIVIRGLGSLTLSSSPLIVVDGIPLNDGGVGGTRNPLNTINPNDIENMVVLKDASATSIYGSRAANGVIMITTKKGRDGEFKFNYSGQTTVYDAFQEVDVLSTEQFRNTVNSLNDPDATALMGTSDTNWQDQIYKTAFGSDHTFSAYGNALGMPLRVSLGYSNQDGILKGDNFERTTGSLSLTPKFLDDHLSLEVNANGSYTENTFADRGAIGSAVYYDPTQPVYDPNSKYGGYSTWTDANGNKLSLAPTNPVALLNLIDDISDVRRLITNAKVDYKLHFFPDLTATVNAGLDFSNSHGSRTTDPNLPIPEENYNGALTTYRNEAKNKLFDAYLTYSKDLDDHSLKLVGGYSYQSFEFDNFSYDSEREEDGVDPNIIDKSKNVLLSYFGRLNYDYAGKYLLTATLRADASSKLNPNDRWGFFPSVALAWNVHREDFLFDSESVDELKLRVGYGQVGNVNGLGDYLFLTQYLGSQETANYQFGNAFYQTFRPQPINEDLRWEVGSTVNVGIDYSFFNRRLYGSIDAYQKDTEDLISETIIDPFTNFGNRISANIGDMRNRGVELAVNVVPVRTDKLDWTISYNIAFNDNEITRLPDQQFVGGITGGTGNTVQTHLEGHAPFSYLVYKQVYDTNGKPIEGAFVDRNGDNIINEDDQYLYKDPYADIIMGLSTNLNYNNWDLSIVSRANIGNYVYNNNAANTASLNRLYENNYLNNLHADFLNTGFENQTENNLKSDHYVEEASFFKLDNVTLGYTLPHAIDNMSLRFYGSLQNALIISDYDGLDPEISGGIDNNFYPRPRSFVLGVNVDF